MRARPHFSFPIAEVVLGTGEGSGRELRRSVARPGRRFRFPAVSCFACGGFLASRRQQLAGVKAPSLDVFSRDSGRAVSRRCGPFSGVTILLAVDGAFLVLALAALCVLYWRLAHL